jgi:hypothetical protein
LKAQINEFGQIPKQIFFTPHPKRNPKNCSPNLASNSEDQKEEIPESIKRNIHDKNSSNDIELNSEKNKTNTLINQIDEPNDEVFDIFDHHDNIDSIELTGIRKTKISKDIFLMKTKSQQNTKDPLTDSLFNKKNSIIQPLLDSEYLKMKNFQFIFDREFNTSK